MDKKSIKNKTNRKDPSKIPLVFSPVRAGFPSPANDFIEKKLDINNLLIKHPSATFFVKVVGDSMIKKGIFEGDILVVDKSLEAKNKDVVIAIIDGEFTVKTFIKEKSKVILRPENDSYKDIEFKNDNGFEIWGIVTSVIHLIR